MGIICLPWSRKGLLICQNLEVGTKWPPYSPCLGVGYKPISIRSRGLDFKGTDFRKKEKKAIHFLRKVLVVKTICLVLRPNFLGGNSFQNGNIQWLTLFSSSFVSNSSCHLSKLTVISVVFQVFSLMFFFHNSLSWTKAPLLR